MEDPKKSEILINDFFDSNGQLLTKLISDKDKDNNNVNKLGKLLTEEVKDSQNQKNYINKPLSINQVRKYFDSFLKIYYSKISKDAKKIQLLMLKANSEYSAKRLNTKRFGLFMNNRINIVVKKNGEEFKKYLDAFKLHYEALVGYYPREKK